MAKLGCKKNHDFADLTAAKKYNLATYRRWQRQNSRKNNFLAEKYDTGEKTQFVGNEVPEKQLDATAVAAVLTMAKLLSFPNIVDDIKRISSDNDCKYCSSSRSQDANTDSRP